MAYKEGWVVINQVPTRVKTWGGWIEDTLPDGDSLIVCICGNPGLSPFYHTFLETVHQRTGVPIWVTCHAGHESIPRSTRLRYEKAPNLYDMAGQVQHKHAFIKQYVPANRNLFLIGHSLGAKVVSELLKDSQIANHTRKCYLLMPTLERIGETPNGKFLTRILAFGMTLILFLVWMFSLLPNTLRKFLINCWFMVTGQHKVDDNCMEAACDLSRPNVLKNVFLLALDEMEQIKELDMAVLNAHYNKMKVYFARSDGWAPLKYMDSLTAAKPELDVTVLGKQFCHTFVLENPKEMAEIIAEEIQKERVNTEK